MAAPVTKNLQDGEVTLFDGDSPENSVLLAVEEGNLTFVESYPVKQIKDREALSHLRPGEEMAVTGSFTVKYRELINQGSNPTTPYEAFRQLNDASAWVTTNDDGGEVYTIGLRFTVRSPSTDEEDERITFAKCVATALRFSEASEYNTLAVEFLDFETAPTVAKVAEGS